MKQLIILLLLIPYSQAVFGQTASPTFSTLSENSDESNVIGVVEDVFMGMAEGDSARVRAGFREDPVFFSVFRSKEGEHMLHSDPEGFEKWLISIGTPHEEVYDEQLSDIEVRIDGDLAMVWTKYDFFLGDSFHHCGIDLFQLHRDAKGEWKIFQLSDTKRRKDCEQGEEKK